MTLNFKFNNLVASFFFKKNMNYLKQIYLYIFDFS